MKREEVKSIFENATDEQLKAIMDLNGADVEKAKAKVTSLEDELKESKEAYTNLTSDFEKLKSNNANADEWKSKYDAIVKDNEEKAHQAEVEKLAKEKEENYKNRFMTALGDKKFNHEAIKKDYFTKFSEALDNKDNAGKADADIFHELTKDDANAFQGVQNIKLAGGNPAGNGMEKTTIPRIF